MRYQKSLWFSGILILGVLVFGSCTRILGWGVLLWSTENPPIPSGTVLPVYIRSNINRTWVAGIPEEYRAEDAPNNKIEIPLWQLKVVNSRRDARSYAAEFAPYAAVHAETLQDGLPIRDAPDNGARRVYRLKQGQIIKILSLEAGNPAISTTGEPLPGDWYLVLTEDGVTGYCFSYRLNIFEQSGGGPAISPGSAEEETADPDLDDVLSKTWSPEFYLTMILEKRIDIDQFARQWRFMPGQDTGIARIYHPDEDRTFPHTGIRRTGDRAWRFEGAPLQMTLRSDTTLAVQYTETRGILRTLLFVALPSEVQDIIIQETARREALLEAIRRAGPSYTSANYGTLSLGPQGTFTWRGYDFLIPQIILPSALGSGRITMGLFLGPALGNRYDGVLSFYFDGIGKSGGAANFLYALDSRGFRLEYVPPANIEDSTVIRQAPSPVIIYFNRTEG
jgi:hypothetical protein